MVPAGVDPYRSSLHGVQDSDKLSGIAARGVGDAVSSFLRSWTSSFAVSPCSSARRAIRNPTAKRNNKGCYDREGVDPRLSRFHG